MKKKKEKIEKKEQKVSIVKVNEEKVQEPTGQNGLMWIKYNIYSFSLYIFNIEDINFKLMSMAASKRKEITKKKCNT